MLSYRVGKNSDRLKSQEYADRRGVMRRYEDNNREARRIRDSGGTRGGRHWIEKVLRMFATSADSARTGSPGPEKRNIKDYGRGQLRAWKISKLETDDDIAPCRFAKPRGNNSVGGMSERRGVARPYEKRGSHALRGAARVAARWQSKRGKRATENGFIDRQRRTDSFMPPRFYFAYRA